MHRLIVVSLLGAVFVAGCVSTPGNDCPQGPCQSPGHEPSLLPGWGLDGVQFQECHGGIVGLEAPFDAVRSLVPEDFIVLGRTPATARLVLDARACARVVAGDQVFLDVLSLGVLSSVRPVNSSWAVEGAHKYVLSLLFSDAKVASVLGGQIPVSAAEFGRSDVSIGPAARFDSWRVTDAGCEFAFEFQQQDGAAPVTSGLFQYWTGRGPFVRIESRENYAHQGTSASAPTLDGTCALEPVLGPVRAGTSQAYRSIEGSWKLVPEANT